MGIKNEQFSPSEKTEKELTPERQAELEKIASLIESEAPETYQKMVERRRDIHQYPETGFEIKRTAETTLENLKNLGLEAWILETDYKISEDEKKKGIAGVVGILRGKKSTEGQPRKKYVLTWDMDALPMQEKTGLPYSSENTDAFHGCGHDLNSATGEGITRYLTKINDEVGLGFDVICVARGNEESSTAVETGAAKIIHEANRNKELPEEIRNMLSADGLVSWHYNDFSETGTVLAEGEFEKGRPVLAASDRWAVEITDPDTDPAVQKMFFEKVDQEIKKILIAVDKIYGEISETISSKEGQDWSIKDKNAYINEQVGRILELLRLEEQDEQHRPQNVQGLKISGHLFGDDWTGETVSAEKIPFWKREKPTKSDTKPNPVNFGKVWSLEPDVKGKTLRKIIKEALIRKVSEVAKDYPGLQYEFHHKMGISSFRGDPRLTNVLKSSIDKFDKNITYQTEPVLVPDDANYFSKEIPSTRLTLGARKKGDSGYKLHTPEANFDEEAMDLAAKAIAYMLCDLD
ncbi:MAG: M20/M25/M40 family metallo-hydrolase [Candidatus Paceibacterota bacterium]|jgi:metal-dependent amidase/aminoacylase/carboxypeptidase family protein